MDKFFKKIQALQQKPVHVRQRILIISTALLGAPVVLFWLSIFPSTISEVQQRAAVTASSSISPFASLLAPLREASKSLSSEGMEILSESRYIREQASSTLRGTSSPMADEPNPPLLLSTSSKKQASE